MPSISVDVDIDLDDIDNDDLVEEVCKRLRRSYGKRALSQKEKINLKESFAELGTALLLTPIDNIEINTLDDKIKYEHLVLVFSKYNQSDFERLLP